MIKEFVEKKYKIILAVIIFAQILFVTYQFAFLKEGYHSDELWSYGFAASSEGGYIFMTYDQKELMNFGEWEDCSVLKDYIVVDKSEIFDYKSVYDNCVYDIHPPFYFMVLHFIMSLFLNTWSKWFAFAINIVALVMIQYFLYKLLMMITKDKVYSMMGILFFGFTMGMVNIMIYLRNYALGTALIMGFAYHSTELYYKHKEKYMKSIVLAAVYLFFAVLTVHLNLLVAFILTALYCLYYLFKKEFAVMLRYGSAMLISVLLSIAVFSATIPHLFFTGELTERPMYPAAWQFKIYWAYIQHDIIGFRNSIWPEMTLTYTMLGCMGAVAIIVPFSFIFRKEQWFKDFKARLKRGFVSLVNKRKDFQFPILFLFATVFFVLLVNSKVTNIAEMSTHSRRYIFIVYPVFACIIMSLVYYPIKWMTGSRKYRYIIIGFVMCISMLKVYIDKDNSFYFKYNTVGTSMAEIEDDANVIISFNSPFILTCATKSLMDKKNFFATYPKAVVNHENDYSKEKLCETPLYVAICCDGLIYDGEHTIKSQDDVPMEGSPIRSVFVDDNGNEISADEWDPDRIKFSELRESIKESLDAKELNYIGTDCFFGRYVEIYKAQF